MQQLTTNKPVESKEMKWYLIDAADKRLGKLATRIASLFLGKENPRAVDYMVNKIGIVVVNSDKVDYHPRKATAKMYYRHSNYPGGLTAINLEDQMKKDSKVVISKAVIGMLPKNKQRDVYMSQLRIYKNADHEQTAQNLIEVKVN
jgi:large subunit ribosomal protein L13